MDFENNILRITPWIRAILLAYDRYLSSMIIDFGKLKTIFFHDLLLKKNEQKSTRISMYFCYLF